MRLITYNKEYDLVEVKESKLNDGFNVEVELVHAFKPTTPNQKFIRDLLTKDSNKEVEEIFERYDRKVNCMLENLRQRIREDLRRLTK